MAKIGERSVFLRAASSNATRRMSATSNVPLNFVRNATSEYVPSLEAKHVKSCSSFTHLPAVSGGSLPALALLYHPWFTTDTPP